MASEVQLRETFVLRCLVGLKLAYNEGQPRAGWVFCLDLCGALANSASRLWRREG